MATMQLQADLSKLVLIRQFVAATCRDLDVDDRIIPDLELAVDEICSNIVRHGYGGLGGQVEVTVQLDAAGVQVIVRDWGIAFDPGVVAVPDLDAPLEQRALGGLGLFLVGQLMDDVWFEFGGERGNTVTMLKRLPREGGAG